MDRISSLPDQLIDLILEKLCLLDRVRTSVLSRSWRLRWTLVPSLILDEEFHVSLPRYFDSMESASITNSLLLQHSGGLKEFHIYDPYASDNLPNYLLFQHSIGYVTRCSTLERLILEGIEGQPFALPSSIFSAVNLRHFEIKFFQFSPPSWFQGFPNLTRFVMDSGHTTTDAVSHFVSICPQLEEIGFVCMELDDRHLHENLCPILELKSPKITRLWTVGRIIHIYVPHPNNLESVSFSMYPDTDDEYISNYVDKFRMFTNSMQLQHVSFNGRFCKFLGNCKVIHMLPRFDQMKSLDFKYLALHDSYELCCFLSFCVASPNVKNLKLKTLLSFEIDTAELKSLESLAEKYINDSFGHLVRVDLLYASGTRLEVKIIELLLRFSPVLELMRIGCHVKKVPKLKKIVSNLYRASPKARFQYVSF